MRVQRRAADAIGAAEPGREHSHASREVGDPQRKARRPLPSAAIAAALIAQLLTDDPAARSFLQANFPQLSYTQGLENNLSAFSVDLMTAPEAEIPKGHAVLTVVDGKVVYQAK